MKKIVFPMKVATIIKFSIHKGFVFVFNALTGANLVKFRYFKLKYQNAQFSNWQHITQNNKHKTCVNGKSMKN